MESKEYISFYKMNKNDKVYWVDRIRIADDIGAIGAHEFSFDKKKIYNLFEDYPHALSAEEKEIFDKENQFWAKFFAWRST